MYLRPQTLKAALDGLAVSGSRILSGGTDFFPTQGDRPIVEPIIDISNIRELKGITLGRDYVRIGGRTTWTEILKYPLPRAFEALKIAASTVGSVQIQNLGTVAGNLCNASPAADGVPPLLILDAEVELTSASGCRRLPLSDFLVGYRETSRRPDELLTAVIVPRDLDEAPSTFLKLGARRYLVISVAMVASLVQTDAKGRVSQARIAVGSCSVAARRLEALERRLIGAEARTGLGALADSEDLGILAPIDDLRATADYRRDAVLTLVRRALDACVEKT